MTYYPHPPCLTFVSGETPCFRFQSLKSRALVVIAPDPLRCCVNLSTLTCSSSSVSFVLALKLLPEPPSCKKGAQGGWSRQHTSSAGRLLLYRGLHGSHDIFPLTDVFGDFKPRSVLFSEMCTIEPCCCCGLATISCTCNISYRNIPQQGFALFGPNVSYLLPVELLESVGNYIYRLA